MHRNIIYKEILELFQYLFHKRCSKLNEHYKMITYIKIVDCFIARTYTFEYSELFQSRTNSRTSTTF